MNIPENEYKEIEELISSDESVVGIDAKKTHVVIIYMLKKIQNQLDDLERRVDTLEQNISE